MKLLSRLRQLGISHEYDLLGLGQDNTKSAEEAEIEAYGVGAVMPNDIPNKASNCYLKEFEVNFCQI